MHQNISFLNEPSVFSPSRLLIPEFLLPVLNSRIKQMGTMKLLFHFMVNHDHFVYKNPPDSREGKIVFQPSWAILHKKDFFPYLKDWEKFRFYAMSQRVSMSFLFVKLLMAWEGFFEKDIGTPTFSVKIILFQTLEFSYTRTFLKINHLII